MPKYADAVILMPQNLDKIKFVCPDTASFEAVFSVRAFSPFSDEVLHFLQTLSFKLLQSSEAKVYPDVITFAFWCRKASLLKMKADHISEQIRLGRGVVFHIVPSNVPVNFAYSLAAGLLAGNANVVRVPTKEFPQVEIICAAIRDLLNNSDFSSLSNYITLLRYEHDDGITAFFSQKADVRIIWGGDNTINEIRRAPLPARSFDLAFADRYSLCAINAEEYLKEKAPVRIAIDFYNDTYLFDQNACTAPHLIVWLGTAENVAAAKKTFWSELHKIVKERYVLQPVLAIDKYTVACDLSIKYGEIQIEHMPDNLIVRVSVDSLLENIDEYRCRAGYFIEFTASSLNDITRVVNRKYQTLSYLGFQPDVLRDFMLNARPYGIDRIVPIGKTTDFSLVWDGYDLIRTLSRVCVVS